MASRVVAAFCASALWFVVSTSALAERLVVVPCGGAAGDGAQATAVPLHRPFGVDSDRQGNLFVVELEGGHVHQIDAKNIRTTIAGNGTKGFAGDGGPAIHAVFNAMHNLAIAPSGDIYIADTLNHRVRKIDARTGVITTFAGSGKQGFSGDGGPACDASFNGIYCIAFNPDFSRLFLADLENRRVRAISMQTELVETIAGDGNRGLPADGGEARRSSLVDPRAVAADAEGNVYVLERSGHALRVVDNAGKIRTLAGIGRAGNAGDGGPARNAALSGPKHLCLDRMGRIIIADTENHVIRQYDPKTGTISRIAGTGNKGSAGAGGPPLSVELSSPHGVHVHADGTLYVVDTGNDRVLKLVRE